MDYSLLIGSVGSALLLLAFFLTVFGKLKIDSETYALMNFAGAALSCYASLLIGYMPFAVLEGTWALVALAGFIRTIKNRKKKQPAI
ncbi:MAG: hypothetical protein WAX07_02860 [Candidatus Altiarchaeia archaeon]